MPSEKPTDEVLEGATENTEPITQAGRDLANAAIAAVAADNGRTVKEQIDRMGDRFAYEDATDDPHQRQLDDYERRNGVVVEEMPVSSMEVARRAH